MKLTRRSVLGAIGTVGVGTGAAFGSGAFTSTTAQRAVQVNILGGGNGYDSTTGVIEDASDEAAIADDITEAVGIDVLVDISSDAVSVEPRTNADIGTVSDLFPSSNVYTDLITEYSDGETNYVSLVANDVVVVFGGNGALPANSTVEFDELFAFGRTSIPNGDGRDVTFETENESNAKILSDIGGDSGGGDPSSSPSEAGFSQITSGDTLSADVKSGTSDGATEDLDIIISDSA